MSTLPTELHSQPQDSILCASFSCPDAVKLPGFREMWGLRVNVGSKACTWKSFRALQALTQSFTVQGGEAQRRERGHTRSHGFLVQAGQDAGFRIRDKELFLC